MSEALRLHDTLCTDAEEQRLGVPVTAETWERARPRPTGQPPVAIFGDTPEPQPRGLIHWGWWVALQALLLLLLLGAVWVASGLPDWAGSLDSIGYSLRHSATGELP